MSAASLVLARDPARFWRAFEEGGASRFLGLAHIISVRHARDQVRRHAYRRERSGDGLGFDPLDRWGVSPDPVLAHDLQHDLARLLEEAAVQVGANRAPQLLSALHDKLETGDADTALAARHGVQREQVNRAWSRVRRELRAA